VLNEVTINLDNEPYPLPAGRRWYDEQTTALLDFIPAPDLERIGLRLIAECEELNFLDDHTIVYLWKRQGGETNGKAVLGKATKTSGLVKHFGKAEWVIWLGADHFYTLEPTCRQVEACLFHELLHCGEDTENKKAVVVGHDWQGFSAEVRRYGAWCEGLKSCQEVWEQTRMFD
jgi:hypothetical protein